MPRGRGSDIFDFKVSERDFHSISESVLARPGRKMQSIQVLLGTE